MINPGTSFLHSTACLLTDFTYSWIKSIIAWVVFSPGIISTNFINCGGLKKWIPINFSGRDVVFAISVIGNVLVFDANITSGPATASNSAYTFFFNSIISGTTSIIISASFTASFKSTIGIILEKIALDSSFDIFSLETSLSKLHFIFSIALSKNSCLMSRNTTLYPAVADTCAIPWPITPEPKTVIFFTNMVDGIQYPL